MRQMENTRACALITEWLPCSEGHTVLPLVCRAETMVTSLVKHQQKKREVGSWSDTLGCSPSRCAAREGGESSS